MQSVSGTNTLYANRQIKFLPKSRVMQKEGCTGSVMALKVESVN